VTAREEILAALPGLAARLGRDTFTPVEEVVLTRGNARVTEDAVSDALQVPTSN
jgi:hypothetical protein